MSKKNREVKSKVEELAAKQNAGGQILGHICWWTLKEVEISRAQLEELLTKSLGVNLLPAEPRKKRAVRRALDELEIKGLIRKVRDDEEVLAYSLFEEKLGGQDEYDAQLIRKMSIVYDKKKQDIGFRGVKAGSAEAKKFMELLAKHQGVYNAEDIRTVMLNFIHHNAGVTLRESGGVYFLPGTLSVGPLTTFVEGLNGGSSFIALPSLDNSSARSQMFGIVKDELTNEIEKTVGEVQDMLTKDMRESTLATRLETFKTLKFKCEAYSDLLKADAEEMAKKVDELSSQILQALEEGAKQFEKLAARLPRDQRVEYLGTSKHASKYGKVVGWYHDSQLNSDFVKVYFPDINKTVYLGPGKVVKVDANNVRIEEPPARKKDETKPEEPTTPTPETPAEVPAATEGVDATAQPPAEAKTEEKPKGKTRRSKAGKKKVETPAAETANA